MNEAVGHQLDRTDQEIVFRVVSSYYDVLLAAKQLEVADQSANTAKSIMDRSQARFDSGLTVESDLLTAKVRMAARQQDMIRARNTQLWVISADGSGLKQLTFPGTASADVFVSWSPQGNSIVFERDNAAPGSAIYILNVDETGAGEKLIFQGATPKTGVNAAIRKRRKSCAKAPRQAHRERWLQPALGPCTEVVTHDIKAPLAQQVKN